VPVPGYIIFGPNEHGQDITVADVRALPLAERTLALKRRLDRLLVGQIDELAKVQNGSRVVYSPFPLAVLTCVAIETVGQVFHGPSKDDPKEAFVWMANRIDRMLSRKPPKAFKTAATVRWPNKKNQKFDSYSDVIYHFFRNTLIHGYHGRGVYLTEDETQTWSPDDGFLYVNPYWFWTAFRRVYDELFRELDENPNDNNRLRMKCREYVERMLY